VSTELRFGPAELVNATGCSDETSHLVFKQLHSPELIYRPLSEAESATALDAVEDLIQNKPLRAVGDDNPQVWESGWAELVAQLENQPITVETLRPQYFHKDVPCRLFGGLVQQVTPYFEYWVGLCVRLAIFAEFLREQKHIIEFGCGTGINLLLLSQLCRGAKLIGCDWATPSQTILARMARENSKNIEGCQFNMLTAKGDSSLIIDKSAVLTVHALEQLGNRWRPFLDFLLTTRPALCVHIEPLVELYAASKRLDVLAERYHRKRRYLEGFVPAIKQLAMSGAVKIIALRRTGFAGLYQEAYSILVWRPVGS